MLRRGITQSVGRGRVRKRDLREGHVLVLILVSTTVDEAEDSPNSLRVERKRNGGLQIDEQ
jgi:hypothetical protein